MLPFDKKYPYIMRLIALKKELFFAVALLSMAIAIVTGYVLPKKYEAKTTIFIEQNVIADLVKGIAVSPSMQQKIKNLTVMLTSRNLLTRILKAMDKDLAFKNESDQETYIKELQQRVLVSLNEKQGLLAINFKDPDPVFARDFVNTMARVYIEQNTSTKRDESTEATKFLAEQIQTYKKRLDVAEDAINKYKSEKGLILSTDESFVRGQINEGEKKVEELLLRSAALKGRWEIMAPTAKGGGTRKGKASNPEAELKRLLSIYTEKNPKVIRARAALNSGGGGEPDAPRESVNREGVTAGQSAKLVKLEMDAINTMVEHQRKDIESNKALLREMPLVKAELAEMNSKKAQEADIYNQLVTRYGQSEISKQMELNDKSTTFRVIDPAVIPEYPNSPNRPVIILIGIALGIAAGVLSVYLADQLNRSIRSTETLKSLALPIFAAIPLITSEAENLLRAKQDKLVMSVAGGCFALVLGVLMVESMKLMGWTQALVQLVRPNL